MDSLCSELVLPCHPRHPGYLRGQDNFGVCSLVGNLKAVVQGTQGPEGPTRTAILQANVMILLMGHSESAHKDGTDRQTTANHDGARN